jgi:hypothetical protein
MVYTVRFQVPSREGTEVLIKQFEAASPEDARRQACADMEAAPGDPPERGSAVLSVQRTLCEDCGVMLIA